MQTVAKSSGAAERTEAQGRILLGGLFKTKMFSHISTKIANKDFCCQMGISAYEMSFHINECK